LGIRDEEHIKILETVIVGSQECDSMFNLNKRKRSAKNVGVMDVSAVGNKAESKAHVVGEIY